MKKLVKQKTPPAGVLPESLEKTERRLPAAALKALAVLASHTEAGKPGEYGWIPEKAAALLGSMPKGELVDTVLALTERFVMAVTAMREETITLAICEFGMHPHEAEKLNLPTMLGSLAGLGLPAIDAANACATCAFRQGSCANQCPATVSDALGCIESKGSPFFCHEGVATGTDPKRVCRGYALALKALNA
ncbi:hypothetical protein [Polaromonas sp.]|uniref:hypothetical protein n=1 Tax=Polaromonas sp. TaxID=1869339 RepID=UPI00352A2D3C